MVYHVVAVSENGVIGKGGRLPWHFPADLKFFKNLTTGHTVIMGRKTFDSLGKALPNRKNIVISRQTRPAMAGVEFVPSIEAALNRPKQGETFIIGGASIYAETLQLVDGIYLTRIGQVYDGDVFYPGIPAAFREVSRQMLQANPSIEAIFYRRS